jgi:CheY-like chemotaxis protein
MNGIEFTQKVRQNPDFQNIPIIMATTETDESQKTLATKAGVNDFISKPFNEEILIRKIKMFVKSDSEY